MNIIIFDMLLTKIMIRANINTKGLENEIMVSVLY